MARQYSSISVATVLATGINASVTSMTVATGTGTTLMGGVTLAVGDTFAVALDPDTASEEIVYITAVASDTFTISRHEAGTQAQSHATGASVKHVFTGNDAQHFEDGINSAVTLTGTQTLSNKTLTAPKFANGGYIADNNGNEQIKFATTASAVNEVSVTNAATGNGPTISASGSDTDIDLNLSGKGTGKVKINGEEVGNSSISTVFMLMGA